MPAPSTSDEFLDLIRKSGVLEEKRLDCYLEKARATSPVPTEPSKLAGVLVRDGMLTHFQAEQFLQGKWRRFTIGKYKVLERIGSGGMGSVYLCEHKLMRRRVAVKVLPTAKADDTSSLERFYREARAVAALDHVNIVRAYDIDQDDKLHFLVMEYVDGSSLQEIVKRAGPLDPIRAAHYIRQAALGLQHAHEVAGLVHRDIKPGNILVDRSGTVKVLDMGLARFFHDEDDVLTKKYDENVLGTADYLAPEQALDSHSVDIRADIYSLGATFYYCLSGRSPFNEGSVAQKLIWHQTRQPKPIKSVRAEVPDDLVTVIDRMMAKDPAQRYQTPQAVADALEPWSQQPIAPPPEEEMPRLSLAAMGTTGGSEGSSFSQPVPLSSGTASPAPRKNWQVPASPSTHKLSSAGQAPAAAPSVPARAAPPAPAKPIPAPSTSPARPNSNGEMPRTHVAASSQPPARPGAPAGNIFAAPRAAAFPAPEPITDEEAPPWEHLSPDTDDLTARADTAPRSAHKSPAPRRPQKHSGTSILDPAKRGQFLLIMGVIGFFILVGIVVAMIISFFGGGKPKSSTETERQPAILTVKQDGSLRSIKEALKSAQPGDTIQVSVPVQECIILDEKRRYSNLTIESADPSRPVVWSFPTNPAGATHLIDVRNIEGLKVRGFIMDGDNKVEEAVSLHGNCPGLKLEDLKIKGFTKAGVLVTNCAGTTERPVTLSRLTFIGEGQQKEAGLLFSFAKAIKDPPLNQHIKVQKCTFEGTIKQLDAIPDPVSNDATVIIEK
jgi:eukaryotic-like serine/threonine-protein kinase